MSDNFSKQRVGQSTTASQKTKLIEKEKHTAELIIGVEECRSKQRQLMDIIEFLPDATLAIDNEKHVIIWNKAIEKMTGIPAAEMIGKGDYAYALPFCGEIRPILVDLFFMGDKEIETRYPNLIHEGVSITIEVFCPALNNNKGAWIFAKASPLHDQAGNIIGAIESIRDITVLKRLETALTNEKKLLETTLISIGDGVISTDHQGHIVFLNRIAEFLTGWTQEEAIRKRFEDVFNIVNEFSREKSENIVKKVLESGKMLELDDHTTLISKDGVERSLEDIAAPIVQENGEIVGVVLVFRDISAKKRSQEKIEFLSYHDQLTGLYNRRFYEDALIRLDTERKLANVHCYG